MRSIPTMDRICLMYARHKRKSSVDDGKPPCELRKKNNVEAHRSTFSRCRSHARGDRIVHRHGRFGRRTDAVSVPGVIGAAYNKATRADSDVDVRRQGGFATAGSVRWLAQAPADVIDVAVARPAFNSPGVMGAMSESRSLARSAEEVVRQGGYTTAAAVHWLPKAPTAKKIAAAS